MIVECPNCLTKFSLDEKRLKPEGSKVRCSKCREVFTAAPPHEESPRQRSPIEDTEEYHDFREPQPGRKSRGEDDFPGGGRRDEAMEESEEKDALLADLGIEDKRGRYTDEPALGEEVREDEAAEPEKDFNLSYTIEPKKKTPLTKKSLIIGLVGILLIAGMLAGGYFMGPKIKGIFFSSAKKQETAENATALPDIPPDKVSKISLENVRQYFVANEKAGQIFVIEGKARNNFTTTKEMIKLEASLFDASGKKLATKEFYCGNTVSLFQLQILSQEELEAALNAKVGILTNNVNLKTAMDVPFMAVFFKPPDTIKEFGLKVIDASDPGEKK